MSAPIFGYHMPSYTFPGVDSSGLFERVAERALAAEAAGFDLVTVMDHFHQIRGVGPETEPMMEAYTVLAALAVRTTRIKLGTLVTGVTYRNPALLAKTVTTLDVISRGRAVFGIGAAWNESEHLAYGFAFPKVAERMDRLEEAITIAKKMFVEQRASFAGKRYAVEGALNTPPPVQAGGPQILIGGTGEQRTLRIVARHADLVHWNAPSLDELKRKREVLAGYCETERRDLARITLTVGAPVQLFATDKEADAAAAPAEGPHPIAPATPERAAEILRPYIAAGFTGFTFRNVTLSTPEQFALAGRLKKLLS